MVFFFFAADAAFLMFFFAAARCLVEVIFIEIRYRTRRKNGFANEFHHGCKSFSYPCELTAIEAVARMLGNTPAICRKCYVHPGVLDSYLEGRTIDTLAAHDEIQNRARPFESETGRSSGVDVVEERVAQKTESPVARKVIIHHKRQHDGEPYKAGAGDQFHETIAMVHVHEKKHDERRFRGRDEHRQGEIQRF